MGQHKKRSQRIERINKLLTNLVNVEVPDDSLDQEVLMLLDEFYMESMAIDEYNRLYDKYYPSKNENLYKVEYQ